ncbi:MAG TPA: pyruvate kinase [Candidatus Choladousia intestinipullorum]|nr:pyruvate kinase [Candidatus Choladousia intestinipullorum]
MKKTKIICTMGPNADNVETLRALVANGMDIARFNFSHGDHEEQKNRMDLLKSVRTEMKKPIAMLLDTKGPEIRTGLLENGAKVTLKEGDEFTLTSEVIKGDQTRVSQTYAKLAEDVRPGDMILIDDGLIALEVKGIRGEDIVCTVKNGGELGQRKGVNVPGVRVNLPAITEKDRDDIIFGISQGIDFIAASFVRDADAIEEIKEILKEHNAEHIDVIAKIENSEGIRNIDRIISAADGVMVARGDLGVEIPAYEVPHVQNTIVDKCNKQYKPVIIATQMLDSMIRNPRPTRAEVTDVANAIREGADVIMLSGETAAGKYPVEALRMMAQIAETTEKYLDYTTMPNYRSVQGDANVSNAVGVAAVRTATNVGAKCIVTPTMSGQTARMMSNFRSQIPVYAVTPNEWAQRKMQIYWGVTPLKGYSEDSTEHIISHAMYVVKREGFVEQGDMVVFTAGDPATNLVKGKGAVTNMMHVIQAK